jgi:hypothetical protein
MFKKIGIGLAALGAVAFGVYIRFIRPWQLRWGATDEEVARAMPGDDVVKQPTFNATRAVTIQARPEEIWPWLVQIGITRAGWYSYDWLDNLGKPSAQRILPQFQHVAVDDLVPISPVRLEKSACSVYAFPGREDTWTDHPRRRWASRVDRKTATRHASPGSTSHFSCSNEGLL